MVLKKNPPVDKNSFAILSLVLVNVNLKSDAVNLDRFIHSSGTSFDLSDYRICDQFMNDCQDLLYLPNSNTFVLSNDSFQKIIQENEFANNVGITLGVDEN